MKYSPKCIISAYNIMIGYRLTKQQGNGQSTPSIRCSCKNFHQIPDEWIRYNLFQVAGNWN
jgi:hypothetical protein